MGSPSQQVPATASRKDVKDVPRDWRAVLTSDNACTEGESLAARTLELIEETACSTAATSVAYSSSASVLTWPRSDFTLVRLVSSVGRVLRSRSVLLTSSIDFWSASTLEQTAGVSSAAGSG